jgi:hypothetical protein
MYEPKKVWWDVIIRHGIAHSAQYLATDRTIRASNPGKNVFSCFQVMQTGFGADWLPRVFTGLKAAGTGI